MRWRTKKAKAKAKANARTKAKTKAKTKARTKAKTKAKTNPFLEGKSWAKVGLPVVRGSPVVVIRPSVAPPVGRRWAFVV